ncbi:HAD family hydrolase [Aeromonas salmonicida]|uniref:HAD family hydrolase n=1 Tax=Aeromonas salmonicida TaxID=645 RepID=UPI00240E068E|nr:HAD family hydrolase [Aeromonas salmonicida]WFC12680.1 HAD family hydrolase [Aeromonas salmonicida]
MNIKLLITDLDNTLYDWVSFYSASFMAMVNAISGETGINKMTLLDEYKSIHRKYKNTEQPFATLDVPSIQKYYNCSDRLELNKKLSYAFEAFSNKRFETLKLYDGVEETLRILKGNGVVIVGHTESFEYNAMYRLNKLGILPYFKHVYTLRDFNKTHPDLLSAPVYHNYDDIVKHLEISQRKPNPALLTHICEKEGVDIAKSMYVGDSLSKDISMAQQIGMKTGWASYGRVFDNEAWDILLAITHWDENDAKREKEISLMYKNVKPEITLNNFSDILNYV